MSKRAHSPQWDKRRRERELAFQTLYGVSFSETPDLEDLKNAFMSSSCIRREDGKQEEPKGFAWDLVLGVWDNEKFLDADIKKYAHNWRIERMGRLELLILRMALYELNNLDTPDKVAISEYLNLADQFGVESAKSFINGILDTVTKKSQPAS